jgi:hypothetical protein
VVELLTQNPKVKGSNPSTGSRNEKIPKKDQKMRKKLSQFLGISSVTLQQGEGRL